MWESKGGGGKNPCMPQMLCLICVTYDVPLTL